MTKKMERFMALTGAKLRINHNRAQNVAIPKAPAFVE